LVDSKPPIDSKIKIHNCSILINHYTDHNSKASIPINYIFNMRTWPYWIVFRG
jgi:hypothetical protein